MKRSCYPCDECSVAWFLKCALTSNLLHWLIPYCFLIFVISTGSSLQLFCSSSQRVTIFTFCACLKVRWQATDPISVFLLSLTLFLWTSMADVMSARMHYTIFIGNHDVHLVVYCMLQHFESTEQRFISDHAWCLHMQCPCVSMIFSDLIIMPTDKVKTINIKRYGSFY
jgi:hypothetical protein